MSSALTVDRRKMRNGVIIKRGRRRLGEKGTTASTSQVTAQDRIAWNKKKTTATSGK